MAESIRISELAELVSGSVVGTTKVPVVDGGETKYTQASSIKAYVNSDVATDAELSARIATVNSTIDGLTTADISENASYLYYTDIRVTNRLNALNVLSGSSTSLTVTDGDTTATTVDSITFDGAVVTNNGSGDVTVTVPSALRVGNGEGIPISNVDFIVFDGATITDDSNGDITVTISGGSSTDISALNTFTGSTNVSISSINSFTSSIRGEINGIEAFTASFSSSVQGRITTLETSTISLPTGLLSSSQQITDLGFISESSGTPTQGTISSSQQITNFGFLSSSAFLGTETNYHIISQSIIIGDPIDSNLLLSSIYIDKTKTITFSQFSQSLDSRFGSGGGSDYISNVAFNNNNQLVFTGTGFAFNGNVTLANGIVSSSNQITSLGFVQDSDINQTYIQNRLPTGVLSGSTQISNLGFINNGTNVVSESAQIVLLNTTSGGFDTSHVSENVNFQYYSDAKVQTILNGLTLVSSSVLPSGSVSSSSQIDYQLVYNKVEFYTGSNNLIILSGSQSSPNGYGSPWVKFTVDSPSTETFGILSNNFNNSTLISGSTQISNLGFITNENLLELNNWTGSAGGFAQVSESINIRINNIETAASSIPNGTVSGSSQIDYNFVTNVPQFANGDGIVISQSLENEITITSNASAPTWDSISLKPYNIVTSSIQVQEYNVFAKTGSANTFYGTQTVSGELQTDTLTVTGASTFQADSTFEQNIGVGGTSTFNGPVSNGTSTAVSIGGNTASLDFSTGNLFEITLDASATTYISASNYLNGQTAIVLISTANQSTASFSNNIKQPFGSFYTASEAGSIDIITLTVFQSADVYITSVKNNFV